MPATPHALRAQATALPDFVLRQFDRRGAEPDHRQLYRILQKGIRESVLGAGLKLPPTRMLAQTLGIARNTVVHVYEQLALEGYVLAGVGRGTFVAAVGPRLVDRAAGSAVAPARRAQLSKRGSRLVDEAGAGALQWGAFTPGVPEVRLFPAQVWSRLHARLWRAATPQQLSYATGHGDAGLREAIADYLRGTRGVACTPEQVVVTSGTQQSLLLVAQLLADPGDAVWLEDPGYWGARSVFRAMGLKLVPVPVDAEGLAPTPQQLREPPRAMFVSPSHQYPTGTLMSHGRRRQLLEYAAVHGVWIVEDDYDSEFRSGARPLPALQGLDEHGRVIYLGTFSKTLFPALRIAYLVLPPDLVEGFARALNELYREGQTLQQAVLARFLADGHYASHIRRMRAVYAARHDALIAAIDRHFGATLPIIGGDAGLHLVLGLPPPVDDRAVALRAQRAGVTTRPLSLYQLRPGAPARGLLLGYGAVREEEIASQFARLARVVQAFL
jgi:GntR family transcriptional regulator / MocR family aminotransferase